MLRVTEILAEAGMVDYSFCSEDAMTRGTYVHTACEMIDKGTLDWENLDPVLRPYCDAYIEFLRDTQPEIVLSEERMEHSVFQYTGKPDRVIQFRGRMIVVDIKSGTPVPGNWLQVAAYRELIRVNKGIEATQGGILSLRDDGTYRFATCALSDMKRDLQTFLAALAVVKWRRENL